MSSTIGPGSLETVIHSWMKRGGSRPGVQKDTLALHLGGANKARVRFGFDARAGVTSARPFRRVAARDRLVRASGASRAEGAAIAVPSQAVAAPTQLIA